MVCSWYLSFLISLSVSTVCTEVVTIEATKDTFIDGYEGNTNGTDNPEDTLNFGAAFTLFLGADTTFGPDRILLDFPLQGLVDNGALVSAEIQLSIRDAALGPHLVCSEGNDFFCPTVHIITTSWGEGRKSCCPGENATANESSWIHSEFPMFWNNPGGDFVEDPIGMRAFESDGDTMARFVLDTDPLMNIIENIESEPYYGFLLNGDNDFGLVSFWSRECTASACRFPPRLVLEFDPLIPTATPTIGPTFLATEIPTVAPPSNTEECSEFRQEMVLEASLSVSQESMLATVIEENLEDLPSDFVGADIRTVAFVTSLQQEEIGTGGDPRVRVVFQYSLCFVALADSPSVELLDSYPRQFVAYMLIHRLDFGDKLRNDGIAVVPGSMSEVVIVPGEVPMGQEQPKSEDNTAAIAGGAAAAGALVLFTVVVMVFRRRRGRNTTSEEPTPSGAKEVTPMESLNIASQPHAVDTAAGQPQPQRQDSATIPLVGVVLPVTSQRPVGLKERDDTMGGNDDVSV